MRIFSLVYCILWIIVVGIVATLITAMFAVAHLANYVFEKFVLGIVIPLFVIGISAVIIYRLVYAGMNTSFNTHDLSFWDLIYIAGFDLCMAYLISLVFKNIGKATGELLTLATRLRALLPSLSQEQKEGDYYEL